MAESLARRAGSVAGPSLVRATVPTPLKTKFFESPSKQAREAHPNEDSIASKIKEAHEALCFLFGRGRGQMQQLTLHLGRGISTFPHITGSLEISLRQRVRFTFHLPICDCLANKSRGFSPSSLGSINIMLSMEWPRVVSRGRERRSRFLIPKLYHEAGERIYP